jgi:hypothetical protein
MQFVRMIDRQFFFGPITYAIAFALSCISVYAGVIAVMALAAYWALPDTRRPGSRLGTSNST